MAAITTTQVMGAHRAVSSGDGSGLDIFLIQEI
jgi:hypothetical protein